MHFGQYARTNQNTCSSISDCVAQTVRATFHAAHLYSCPSVSAKETSIAISCGRYFNLQVFLSTRTATAFHVVSVAPHIYSKVLPPLIIFSAVGMKNSRIGHSYSYSIDMVPTQKRALLALIQRVTRNDELSILIEKTIKSTIKSNDEELETDDSDDTVVYNENDTDSNHSADGMMID